VTSRTSPSPFTALKRVVKQFMEANLLDWAAALTYYGLLSLFPALIAMVSLLGLFGDPESTTETMTEIVASLGPDTAADTFSAPIESIASSQGTAGFAFTLGVAVALWAASGYVGAFIRASNSIYKIREGRSFWKLRPLQIGVTLVMIAIMAVLAVGLVMTGPVVRAVAGPVGLGDTAVTIWDIGKWPVMVMLFATAVAVLYYASPNAEVRSFASVMPGSLVAVVVWAIASAGFAFYVANFGSYDETYGTLGGFVVLLIWFWITNLAILLGHLLNAERELPLEPREQPKPWKTN